MFEIVESPVQTRTTGAFPGDVLPPKEEIFEAAQALAAREPDVSDLTVGKLHKVGWLDPSVGDYRLLDERGEVIAIQVHGPEDGAPFMLMHGTPACRVGVMPSYEELRKVRARIITYDRGGYGQSSASPEEPCVADTPKKVASILDALNIEEVTNIGRSGGCPHALACAADLPGRVKETFLLCPGKPQWASQEADLEGLTPDNRDGYFMDRLTRRKECEDRAEDIKKDPYFLLRLLWEQTPSDADRDVIARHGGAIALSHYIAVANGGEGYARDTIGTMDNGWGFNMGDIKSRVTLWTGSEDPFSPAAHQEWYEQSLENAEVTRIVTPGLSHFNAMELPRFFDSLGLVSS